jgi:hypothetical protein
MGTDITGPSENANLFELVEMCLFVEWQMPPRQQQGGGVTSVTLV